MTRPIPSAFAVAGLALILACSGDQLLEAGNGDTVELPASVPENIRDSLAAAVDRESARVELAADSAAAVHDSLVVAWDVAVADSINAVSPLPYCEPRAYASDMAVVGPGGGRLRFGGHVLSVPRGALDAYVLVTAEALAGNEIAVRLSPHGLAFAGGVTLELDYSACTRLRQDEVRVAYLDDRGTILEYPSSRARTRSRSVTATLEHFSKYAVAY
jgi:hypothetical protein